MYDRYLVTGGTGFLGGTVVKKLVEAKQKVVCLVLPNDSLLYTLPKEVEVVFGGVNDEEALQKFFQGDVSKSCLIHCAGIISIASKENPLLFKVNVDGTKRLAQIANEKNIGKMIYVASVHAIPEKPGKEEMSENDLFSQYKLVGQYARSKSEACKAVFEEIVLGLRASIVLPAGIIGPNDIKGGNITSTVLSYCKGNLPFAVKGGYNFVDVRDVADGIIKCSEKGRDGQGYILSGHYATVKDILEIAKKKINGKKVVYLPLWIIKCIAPILEHTSIRKKEVLFLTPYSAYTLGSNSNFTCQKAMDELDFHPRATEKTVSDLIDWYKDEGLLNKEV